MKSVSSSSRGLFPVLHAVLQRGLEVRRHPPQSILKNENINEEEKQKKKRYGGVKESEFDRQSHLSVAARVRRHLLSSLGAAASYKNPNV